MFDREVSLIIIKNEKVLYALFLFFIPVTKKTAKWRPEKKKDAAKTEDREQDDKRTSEEFGAKRSKIEERIDVEVYYSKPDMCIYLNVRMLLMYLSLDCYIHILIATDYNLSKFLNFELRPLLNPRGSPVMIPLAITGYKC